MIIVDKLLEARVKEGRPIRVGMIGAGFMGHGIALQVATAVPGMRLAAIAARNVDRAVACHREAGRTDVVVCDRDGDLLDAIRRDRPAVTDDPMALARAEGLDAIIEATGTIDYALPPVLEAMASGKHVIMMNAELDGTLGPLLKVKADQAGVIYTNVDGDQPGVIMNLYRFAQGIGVRPVLCGNIKGLHDPYRNPTTQKGFAERWGQNAHMVTSFADGTKISFEQAIVANGTGMRVAKRGMYGPTFPAGTPITEAATFFDDKVDLDGPGIVDYVVGAVPSPGVFVLGTIEHPRQRHFLNLYKLGEGPFYCLYTPYHLCHFEVPNTVARAVLLGDAALAPLGPPCVEVVTAAKRDLAAGEAIDGLGGYMAYGLCENASIVARDDLLPFGVAIGATTTRDVRKDEVLTYADVEVPAGRLVDRLRREQQRHFALDVVAESVA